jgi:glutamine synthetase
VQKADEVQILMYALHNVGARECFAGDQYAGLSETCLYYIGGIIKHTKAIDALTNATTNSVIDAYIGLKMQEVTRYRMTTHPVEYDMYYSV